MSVKTDETYFVSTKGDDAWTGRLPEPNESRTDGPFATLTRARNAVREAKAARSARKPFTVLVRGGRYCLENTLSLGARDSGTRKRPLRYRAYPGEKPILDGGREITGWQAHDGKILKRPLPKVKRHTWSFRQLFFNGKRQIPARYPNYDPDDPHGGKWAHVAAVEGDQNQTDFTYERSEPPQWAHPEDGKVAIFSGYDYSFRILPIAAHIADESKIILGEPSWHAMRIGDRYFVQGLLEELDEPGEWYLDPRTGTLYFWPPVELDGCEVMAPVVETLVSLKNARHIEFQGFTIEMCDGDGIQIENSRDCLIARCVVRNCGKTGIVIENGVRCSAKGNDIYECGHGGISISGGDRKALKRGNNQADNNYIHHCARIVKTYRPGVSVQGVGNTVSHNLIHDLPHAGILMGGCEHIIEFNVVRHVNLESSDTGGLYMCARDWAQRGNVIRYNIFSDCGGFGKTNSWEPVKDGKVEFRYPHGTWGIYLDDVTSGTHVYGNILYRVPICALMNHGGRDNTWENNIIFDSPALETTGIDPDWSAWKGPRKELRGVQYRGSPYLKRYPELAEYPIDRPHEMSGVRFVRNIIYFSREGTEFLRRDTSAFPWWNQRGPDEWGGPNRIELYEIIGTPGDLASIEWDFNCIYLEGDLEPCIRFTFQPEAPKLLTWQQWRQQGHDARSVMADPLLDTKTFALRPESPALKLGFKPIPTHKIGLYEDEHRANWPVKEAPGAADLGPFVTVRTYQVPEEKAKRK